MVKYSHSRLSKQNISLGDKFSKIDNKRKRSSSNTKMPFNQKIGPKLADAADKIGPINIDVRSYILGVLRVIRPNYSSKEYEHTVEKLQAFIASQKKGENTLEWLMACIHEFMEINYQPDPQIVKRQKTSSVSDN
jgi:hypothetical protein